MRPMRVTEAWVKKKSNLDKEVKMSDTDINLYTDVCSDRFKSIEEKLDSIDNKLDGRLGKLESSQNKMVGSLIFLGVFVPMALSYIAIK